MLCSHDFNCSSASNRAPGRQYSYWDLRGPLRHLRIARTKAGTLTIKDRATIQKADKSVERLRGEMDSVSG